MSNISNRFIASINIKTCSFVDYFLTNCSFLIGQDYLQRIKLENRMSANNSNASSDPVAVLTQRLKKAEKRLNLLTCEISSIKSELLDLQQNSNAGSNREYSTSTTIAPSETDSNDNDSKRPRYGFVKEDDYVVVYTDGACENNGKCNAKAGIGVWFGGNHPLNISQPVNGRATNNTAEIQACIQAVNTAQRNGVKKLKIKTDSQFTINSMTQWIHRWKKNNWKVASGGDVKNKEDFVVLDKAISSLDSVLWEHVEGHKGIIGNEEADRLARAGALLYK